MPADVARFSLHSITERSAAAEARYLHPSALPKWRTLLALRWQERLEQVTELSLAYYGAEEDAADPDRDRPARMAARQEAARIRRRTVAHRQALAEIEAALARVATGCFGWCCFRIFWKSRNGRLVFVDCGLLIFHLLLQCLHHGGE